MIRNPNHLRSRNTNLKTAKSRTKEFFSMFHYTILNLKLNGNNPQRNLHQRQLWKFNIEHNFIVMIQILCDTLYIEYIYMHIYTHVYTTTVIRVYTTPYTPQLWRVYVRNVPTSTFSILLSLVATLYLSLSSSPHILSSSFPICIYMYVYLWLLSL